MWQDPRSVECHYCDQRAIWMTGEGIFLCGRHSTDDELRQVDAMLDDERGGER